MAVLWDTTLVSRIQPSSIALAYFERALVTEARVLVPAVSVAEVVWGHARVARTRPTFDQLLRWLGRFLARADVTVVPLARGASFAAGRLRAACPVPPHRRRDERRSKPERRVAWVFDLQIAATAWMSGLPVATENVADFERIVELLAELFPRATRLEVRPSPL